MPMDNNKARLATGQALQRLLVVATIAGYWTSYLSQPIEVSELCTSLAVELRTTRYPQILLRVGGGSMVLHSPRRPIADVLL